MRNFDAVLLDIDGTLLDTREFISQAFKHTLLKHCALEVTSEEISQVRGNH